MVEERTDAIVIGAGLAGLVAARELSRQGFQVRILEARDRIGGRCWYRPFPAARRGVEFGGAWFDAGRQTPIMEEVDRYRIHISSAQTYTRNRYLLDGELHDEAPDRSDLQRVMTAIESASRDTVAASSDLRQHDIAVSDWLDRLDPAPSTREIIYARTSAMAGAAPDDHPMLAILQLVAQRKGADTFDLEERHFFTDGTKSLVNAIAADSTADINLGAPVRALRQSTDGVIAETPTGAIAARVGILAVPINVIPHIEFDPPLLDARMRALLQGNACTVWKIWLIASGVTDEFSGSGWNTPFCSLATEGGDEDSRLMVGFALRGLLDPADAVALQQAVQAYAPSARVLAATWHDWVSDHWSRGGWMSEPPLWATTGILDLLAQPHGNIVMAGSDIAGSYPGWMAGAIASGKDAAVETARRLS